MAYSNLIQNITSSLTNIKNINFNISPAIQLSPWNGINIDEFKILLNDLILSLERAIEESSLTLVPYNNLNTISVGINNLFIQLQAFNSTPNQQTFQNAIIQVENQRSNVWNFGIRNYIEFGKDIESKSESFNSVYQDIIQKNNEIEQLKLNVRSLIEPSVAGSLSIAFSKRQGKLIINQYIWLVLILIAGITSICLTFNVIDKIIELLNPVIPKDYSCDQIENYLKKQVPVNIIALLRVGLLIPIYALLIYFFKEYNKERNLVEEYAHRAAVANSLPNYGNLVIDPQVKDQIVTSATNVVFTSPMKKNELPSTSGKLVPVEELNKLIDRVSKLLSTKD